MLFIVFSFLVFRLSNGSLDSIFILSLSSVSVWHKRVSKWQNLWTQLLTYAFVFFSITNDCSNIFHTSMKMVVVEFVLNVAWWVFLYLKSRFSKKATKFGIMFHLTWNLLSKHQIKAFLECPNFTSLWMHSQLTISSHQNMLDYLLHTPNFDDWKWQEVHSQWSNFLKVHTLVRSCWILGKFGFPILSDWDPYMLSPFKPYSHTFGLW